jgi:MarR family transcriptional regulator, 2-MHQ and catechol-resistance regulon repressor
LTLSEPVKQSLDVYIALNRANQWMNAHADQDIRRTGLNRTEFGVLELLYHKGTQPLQQIGGKVLMSSGNITYVVDKLETKGYVRRKASSEDRRLIYAEITEAGQALMESMFPEHARLLDQVMSVLSSEEKLVLADLLKKLGKHAQKGWLK